MHRFVKTWRARGPPTTPTALAERTAPHGTQAAMLKETADVEVKVVDIWTEYGRFPWNKMAAGYPFCCKHPIVWKAMFYTTIGKRVVTLTLSVRLSLSLTLTLGKRAMFYTTIGT
eukprot:scaffold83657_cov45-Phaeocystis_antarctica.AAC.3